MPTDIISSRDALAFLASGLIHRLGNLLFIVQGHAQLGGADGADGDAARAAILGTTERGGRALAVARALLGPGQDPPVEASALLSEIVELLRVPAREAGLSLELSPVGSLSRLVSADAFCPAVVEAVRRLVEMVPTGQGGGIRVAADDTERLRVTIEHVPAGGNLPFPLAFGELQAAVAAALAPWQGRLTVAMAGSRLELSFR